MTTRRRITHILAEHPLSTPESCVSCNTYMKINKIHASIDSTTLIPASAMTEVSRRQYAHVPFLARQKHYSRKSLLGQSSWLAVVRFQREGLIRRSLETAGATKSGWLGDYCYRHEGRIKESRRITLLCSIGGSWKEQRTVTNCRRWERERGQDKGRGFNNLRSELPSRATEGRGKPQLEYINCSPALSV